MYENKATVVIDLGFGDAGKGTITDFLARDPNTSAVVRYNGGSQAAHNVVTPEGEHHTFSQFGSGTFVPGVKTHLSRFMLIDPLSMEREAEHLVEIGCGDPYTRLTVDELAIIISPFQKAANRIREIKRGDGRHGSCGMGIGETMADSVAHPSATIFAGDLLRPILLEEKFRFFQKLKREEFGVEYLDDLQVHGALFEKQIAWTLLDPDAPRESTREYIEASRKMQIVPGDFLVALSLKGSLIFEGAQGVLLDEWYGFHPYTTWSTTTAQNAITLLGEIGYTGEVEKMGVLRAYGTRHGPGPFPSEDKHLTDVLPDPHNGTNPWQQGFRCGWFDLVLARYAIDVCGGVDSLTITHMDRVSNLEGRQACFAYSIPGEGSKSTDDEVALFTSDTNLVTGLQPKDEGKLTDLAHQKKLTDLLSRCEPVYRGVSPEDENFLQTIERELDVPVLITSHGPTANDKHHRVGSLVS